MPMCWKPSAAPFTRLPRVWGIVLSTNLLGAILFAAFVMKSGATSEAVRMEIMAFGRHAADGDFIDTVAKGIGAGFLIAAMTWIIAGAASSRRLIVGIITYAVAVCEFSHVAAGTAEMAALMFGGAMGVQEAALGFVLPALIGNMIGATGLFALIAYRQIRHQLKER
jgi:formate/nitrite transporter FocA (FNT family)